MKFYRGGAGEALGYLLADHSRADEYYLAEGDGLATRYVAEPGRVRAAGLMDGDTYERWVGGYDVETGRPKGRLLTGKRAETALRFVEIVVNGPKSWSLAAAVHPEIARAYEAAQVKAAREIIGWLAEHATTRLGPKGRQVQVPVDQIEAAVVRHFTSRAGDPHRHLHLQINARVLAAGQWAGLHSVGVVQMIEALNGIGHAAVACDPQFRSALAAQGYSLDADGEIRELAPYVATFSQRAEQIGRNIDRYEATWRREHPGEEPGPALRRAWDRRAWKEKRPDKGEPVLAAEYVERWNEELFELGFAAPRRSVPVAALPIGRLDRDAVSELALVRLGAAKSAWNSADIRGEVEKILVEAGVVADGPARRELAEDLTARTVACCVPLLDRADVPEHVRALTSQRVLDVEADIVARLQVRATAPANPASTHYLSGARQPLDLVQRRAAALIAGSGRLVVVEGAAGAGKTTTLRTARRQVGARRHRMVIVTPTLKAAQVASGEVRTRAFSAAWLARQYGYRWDEDGRWGRVPTARADIRREARLFDGDVLLVDEAGMLDQDTAKALLTIADETGARVVLVGDRHQLPAVGRGGVLDHAIATARPEARVELTAVHRFVDDAYARLSLTMRTGEHAGEVFDALHARGEVVIHGTEVERTATLAKLAANGTSRVIADTREQVGALNAAARDLRVRGAGELPGERSGERGRAVTTDAGEVVAVGDRVATRLNDRDLGVANRGTWAVTSVKRDGSLVLHGLAGKRVVPLEYAREHVELAYATTAYGAQGETVERADFLLGERTGAHSAYVAMTRGRSKNTVHLVAETVDDARQQWINTFSRDRADLGPSHAMQRAALDLDQYGTQPPGPRRPRRPDDLHSPGPGYGDHSRSSAPGIGF